MNRSKAVLRHRPVVAIENGAISGWRRAKWRRDRSKERQPTASGIQQLFPAGATVARPIGAALPMRKRPASRQHFGGRTRDRAQFGAKKGPATAPTQKHVITQPSPQFRATVGRRVFSPAAEAGGRESNPQRGHGGRTGNSQRSNAHLRHLNQAELAELGRATRWRRPGRRLRQNAQPSSQWNCYNVITSKKGSWYGALNGG